MGIVDDPEYVMYWHKDNGNKFTFDNLALQNRA